MIRKPERDRTPEEQKIFDDYYPALRIDPDKIQEDGLCTQWPAISLGGRRPGAD
jgi:hypothetical protein